MKENVLVFDVESISLHGEGFAVGAVVANKKTSVIIDRFELLSEEGEGKANDWVKENIIPHLLSMNTCQTNLQLRDQFYAFYMKWKDSCDIYSDVNFPVETNFLSAIVADNPQEREWNMPYPLLDVADIVDISIDRLQECGKNLIKHHPAHDAEASAICLLKRLNVEKRLFQVLDEMNVHDVENNTMLVSLHPDIVSINANKKDVKVTMGLPLGVIDPAEYTFVGIPKKRLVLMCVDGNEFDKRNTK